MFYNSQLLSKKTALGICWLASHLEGKRLKRNQVFEVSIQASCDSVINPEAPLALRLSGQLLLGVVRIYLRKLQYLETDAKNAIDGLQRKEGGTHDVDLPGGGTAPDIAITLPDTDKFVGTFGGDLFGAAFEVPELTSTRAPFSGMGGDRSRESLTFAEDISDVFGSRWTNSRDERFDAVGDDIDRRFSAELERLRSQAAVEAPRNADQLFYDNQTDDYGDGGFGMDDVMEPPPEDMFAEMPVITPLRATPSTAGGVNAGGPAARLSDIHISFPPSVDFASLPEVDLGGEAGGSGGGGRSRQQRQRNAAGAGGQNVVGQRKKKKAHLDVTADGRPATDLPAEQRQNLLKCRDPLLKDRTALLIPATLPALPPGKYHVAAQLPASQNTFMHRPNAFTSLAPEFTEIFQQAYGTATTATTATSPGGGRPRNADDARRAAAAVPGEDFIPPTASDYYDGGDDDNGGGDFGGDDEGMARADYYDDGGAYLDYSAGGGGGGDSDGGVGGRRADDDVFGDALGPLNVEDDGVDDEDLIEDDEDGDGSLRRRDSTVSNMGTAKDGFTNRTRAVLDRLQQQMQPASGSKRRRPSEGAQQLRTLDLDSMASGRSRLEASRLFFEMLVLCNKGYVELEQPEAYGNISIKPLEKMAVVGVV